MSDAGTDSSLPALELIPTTIGSHSRRPSFRDAPPTQLPTHDGLHTMDAGFKDKLMQEASEHYDTLATYIKGLGSITADSNLDVVKAYDAESRQASVLLSQRLATMSDDVEVAIFNAKLRRSGIEQQAESHVDIEKTTLDLVNDSITRYRTEQEMDFFPEGYEPDIVDQQPGTIDVARPDRPWFVCIGSKPTEQESTVTDLTLKVESIAVHE